MASLLDGVQTGKHAAPDRILMMGVEGVGKSTFAAGAPDVVFIAAEDGIRQLNVSSFPRCSTYGEVMAIIGALATDKHEFKTLCIDTLDWLEPMVNTAVCERNRWLDSDGRPDIEKPGYGRGYVAAQDEWRRLLAALDVLRSTRGMEIILICHAGIKTFQNPNGPDYSRYEPRLHRGAAALVKEWVDTSLFAIHEEFMAKEDSKNKVVMSGKRVMYTTRAMGYEAKNRYSLPLVMPLAYIEYSKARDAFLADDSTDANEAAALAAATGDEKIVKHVAAVRSNPAKTKVALARLREIAAQKAEVK